MSNWDTKKDVIFETSEIIDPNTTIVNAFEELTIVKEAIKDNNAEIKEVYNDDDEISELTHKAEEMKAALKPVMELLKAKKEEFKAKHLPLFEAKISLGNKKWKILNTVSMAIAKKQEMKDESPILIGEGNKQKRIVVKMNPTMKKEKIS